MSITNEYLKKSATIMRWEDGFTLKENYLRMECADGFSMSVQASRRHYCWPHEDEPEAYAEVEVGAPSQEETTLMEYAEEKNVPNITVFCNVPVEVVDEIIARHGGLKGEPI